MMILVLAAIFIVVSIVSHIRAERELKRIADARRRESMRRVTETWHFREWEKDLRSSDSI
ncbi:MAG: hypothetical protein ABWY56_15485 [Propionibacteriaceae bacterium]